MIFDCQYQPFGTHQFSLFYPLEFLAQALLSRLEARGTDSGMRAARGGEDTAWGDC